ncbi:DMT family transporter [Halobacterium litoreum]|uniref:DMT family transporter n=1 Tax=Halobacterium litoreum TaxID=2039234 RepID=A0ABD5NDV1_9EURY|nr:EamA family transporter [Halobacterium litoreum]UHH14036.1 EamA family transporter [Halobacterium litoreum]
MTNYRNAVLFLALAAVWGSAFVAIKAGLRAGFEPVLFAAVRYDVAGVIMLAYAARVTDQWRPRSRADWTTVGIAAVLIIAAYHAFLFVGETSPGVSSAAAAVLVGLGPVFTTGFARAFLPSERLSVVGVAGILLGLVGVVVLSDPNFANLLGESTVGELLVALAAASFALGSVLTQRVDDDLAIETLEAWAMLIGAVLMHLLSLGMGETQAIPDSSDALWALAYLSLAASAAGFLVYFELLDRLGPIEINMVSYVAPVFAAAGGVVVTNEPVTSNVVLGFLVIFAGFCLLKRRALADEIEKVRTSWA